MNPATATEPQSHLLPEELLELREGRLRTPWRFRAVLHLLRCAGCRGAAKALPPIKDPSPAGEAVAQALRRLAEPGCGRTLSASHLNAVRRVDDHPLGFAFLLVEEAAFLTLARDTLKPFDLPVAVAETLAEWQPDEETKSLLATALVRLASVEAEQGPGDIAEPTLQRAARLAMELDDVVLEVDLLAARGLLAGARGDDPAGAFEAALRRLEGAELPLREIELCARAAGFAYQAEERETVEELFERGRRARREIPAEDVVARDNALLTLAGPAAEILVISRARGLPPARFDDLAAELAAAEERLAGADWETRGRSGLCRGHFLRTVDADAAEVAYIRAAEAYVRLESPKNLGTALLGLMTVRPPVPSTHGHLLRLLADGLPSEIYEYIKAFLQDARELTASLETGDRHGETSMTWRREDEG